MYVAIVMRGSLVLGFVGLSFLVGCQPAPTIVVQPSNDRMNQGLVLTGTATVRVKPTLVLLRLGVGHSNARPADAKARTEAGIKSIVAAVLKNGISEEDVQTTTFSLARYEPRDGNLGGWHCNSGLEIRVKNVEKAGDVLEAAIAAGANQVRGVEYTVEELQEVRAKARDEACKIAKSKADQFARNFNFKVGPPTYIAENAPYGWNYGANSLSQAVFHSPTESSSESADQILSSGSVAVTLTVNVTYSLLP